jgi:MSHA biogenesis protein MshK
MVADMTCFWNLGRNSCAPLLMFVISTSTFAQALPDPTRPPDSIITPVDQPAARRDSGLQSLIISPTRRAAIINGQTVELGGMLGDAKLVEVNDSYVVMRNAEGKKVLSMFEGVEIKRKVSPPPVSHAVTHKVKQKKSFKKKKSVRKPARQAQPPKSNEGGGK